MELPWRRYFTKCKLILKSEEEVFNFLRLCLTCIVAFKVHRNLEWTVYGRREDMPLYCCFGDDIIVE